MLFYSYFEKICLVYKCIQVFHFNYHLELNKCVIYVIFHSFKTGYTLLTLPPIIQFAIHLLCCQSICCIFYIYVLNYNI